MQSLVRPFGAVGALAFGAGSAISQSTIYAHDPWAPNLGYGFNVCAVGDVDADGVGDYLVTAYKGGGYVNLFSGRRGTLIEQLHVTGCYGMGLTSLGDIDGDQVPDFAIGAPREDSSLSPNAGIVRVYSGVDRSVIYILEGDQDTARFGISLGNAGDIDGDQVDDLIVGSWWEDFALTDMGSVDVFSGATGTHLWQSRGTQSEQWFGTSVAGAGDVNGDQVPDVLIGAPFRWYGDLGFPAGSAVVCSGVDGAVLRTYDGANGGDYFGTSVELVPDVDGDGAPDHAVGSPRHKVFGQQRGAVFVYSGATGAEITMMTGDPNSRFGTRVASGDDLDGDGTPDLIVSACACVNTGPSTGEPGAVEIRKASDGALLGRIEGGIAIGFGYSVDAVGDLNGDGIGEFVYGSHWDNELGPGTGSARVASFADLSLEPGGHELSTVAGGSVALDLDLGPTLAGGTYLVLGSGTGTSPAFVVGGVSIPIAFDAYTLMTLTGPNSGHLVNTFGFLDGAGKASAAITIGAGALSPSTVGLTVWHAAGVANGTTVVAGTNAVPLTLVP